MIRFEDATPGRWLALAIRSESERPHEWLPIGWVIRNRVAHPSYPSDYRSAIRQAWQFSYFNSWIGRTDEECWTGAVSGYAGQADASGELVALDAAMAVVTAPAWRAPFSHRVLHFWSPRSMDPVGSDPSWADSLSRIFTLPGIDEQRFRFGES